MRNSLARRTGHGSRTLANRTPTICVVDPKTEDYQGWDALVEGSGVRLQVVVSAEEALRFARDQAIDLWVVNTELPMLSGFELCSMLKSRHPTTQVFLLADEYSPDDERQAWAARATLFALKGAHDACLNHWLEHQSNRIPPLPICERR